MKVTPVNITSKNTVHAVINDNGLTVATFQKEDAAVNFANYIRANKITNREQWRKLPAPVRVAFVSATCMIEPNLQ